MSPPGTPDCPTPLCVHVIKTAFISLVVSFVGEMNLRVVEAKGARKHRELK